MFKKVWHGLFSGLSNISIYSHIWQYHVQNTMLVLGLCFLVMRFLRFDTTRQYRILVIYM